MTAKTYDVLAIGELLIDLIGTEPADSLATTSVYERHAGGSPANMVRNIQRLGGRGALVATIGDDSTGRYLRRTLQSEGLPLKHLHVAQQVPTSLVLVSRTTGTPDFKAYRMADTYILPAHLPDELLAEARVVHTTCFALSEQPARDSILSAARRAALLGAQLSIDLNYAPSLWPDREQARETVRRYCAHGALVKCSLDDMHRLYGEGRPEGYFERLLGHGARLVCLTLGSDGSRIATPEQPEGVHYPAEPVAVRGEATGAGDAFWAGYLTAWLAGKSVAECARAGGRMAGRKLASAEPLPRTLDAAFLYE